MGAEAVCVSLLHAQVEKTAKKRRDVAFQITADQIFWDCLWSKYEIVRIHSSDLVWSSIIGYENWKISSCDCNQRIFLEIDGIIAKLVEIDCYKFLQFNKCDVMQSI